MPTRRRSGKAWQRRRAGLFAEQRGKCHWCGCDMVNAVWSDRDRISGTKCTIDHVIDLTEGGTNELSNCVAACASCNKRRAKEAALRRNRARMQELHWKRPDHPQFT